MQNRSPLRNRGSSVGHSIPWIAAATVFLIHLIANPHYGFFRDELYFIICGRHPQFGYVDQPPIIPLLSALSQLFGPSLFLLRAIPALFAAAGVFTTCLLVIEYSGGPFAQVIASIVFFFTPVLMNFGMKVSPDSVGLWTWPVLALIAVRLTRGADARLWLVIGVVAGLSIESKYSVAFFLLAMLLGLLPTPQRRIFFNGWFVVASALAVMIALPNFLWQWHHDLPMLELLKNGQSGKNVLVGPLTYLIQEIIITGLLFAGVWLIGLVWLLSNAGLRFLGYAYLILIVEMIVFRGKHYYPADVYPILIAAGAVPLESWTISRPVVRTVLTAIVLVWGVAVSPYNLPVLPERTFAVYRARFERTLHIPRNATATEARRDDSALPGDWADMHGWPAMAATVKRVYTSLPPAEQSQAVVFAGNYGEASAIEFFTPGIPVISEHNQYWLWGTRGFRGNILVQVGGSCFQSLNLYARRTRAATIRHPWAIAYETDLPIWICRGIKKPLSAIWPEIKAYE